jgi:hypothetical protein
MEGGKERKSKRGASRYYCYYLTIIILLALLRAINCHMVNRIGGMDLIFVV